MIWSPSHNDWIDPELRRNRRQLDLEANAFVFRLSQEFKVLDEVVVPEPGLLRSWLSNSAFAPLPEPYVLTGRESRGESNLRTALDDLCAKPHERHGGLRLCGRRDTPLSGMFAGHFGVFWMSVQGNWVIRAGEMHLFVSWTS